MKRLRQIVAKAVIAKGKKRTESEGFVKPPNDPSNILGCWVINHQYSAKKHGKIVEISGKFDVNIWYAYNNHSKTAVYSETIPYRDKIKLHFREDQIGDSNDIQVHVLQHPNCVEAVIVDDCKIKVTIEREFLVELIGETKVCVSVHPLDYEEEWSINDESSSSSSSSSSSFSHSSSIAQLESSSSSSSSL